MQQKLQSTLDRMARPENTKRADGYFSAGCRLLRLDPKSALPILAHARELNQRDPRYSSYLGLAMVLTRTHGKEGLVLCERAVREGYYDADTFLNLGLAYLESGQRRRARETFLQGLKLDNRHEDLRREILAMGSRRTPAFSTLPRGHWLNRQVGRLLHRLQD